MSEITKLEQTLIALKDHEETGNYKSLYVALKLVIHANKTEPQNVSPLLRGLSKTVLEPIFLQIEKSLQELNPEEPNPEPTKKKEKPGQVIFVDFSNKKRLAA